MSKTPIEMMLDEIHWEPLVTSPEAGDGLPVATHRGVVNILGVDLRCYQLSDGRRIFDADDVEKFFGLHRHMTDAQGEG